MVDMKSPIRTRTDDNVGLMIKVDTSQVVAATEALNDLAAAIERVQALMVKPITISLAGHTAMRDGAALIDAINKAKAGGVTI